MDRPDLSIRDVETKLEEELAQHVDSARLHREKMQEHSEKNAFHIAEARRLEEDLKSFRAVVARLLPKPSEEEAPPMLFPSTAEQAAGNELPELADGLPVTAAVMELLDMAFSDGAEFEMNSLTEIVNAYHSDQLAVPFTPKQVSNVLRRLLADNKIFLVHEGRPRHPAVYSMKPPPKKEENANAERSEVPESGE